jgi:hypothetical protein
MGHESTISPSILLLQGKGVPFELELVGFIFFITGGDLGFMEAKK